MLDATSVAASVPRFVRRLALRGYGTLDELRERDQDQRHGDARETAHKEAERRRADVGYVPHQLSAQRGDADEDHYVYADHPAPHLPVRTSLQHRVRCRARNQETGAQTDRYQAREPVRARPGERQQEQSQAEHRRLYDVPLLVVTGQVGDERRTDHGAEACHAEEEAVSSGAPVQHVLDERRDQDDVREAEERYEAERDEDVHHPFPVPHVGEALADLLCDRLRRLLDRSHLRVDDQQGSQDEEEAYRVGVERRGRREVREDGGADNGADEAGEVPLCGAECDRVQHVLAAYHVREYRLPGGEVEGESDPDDRDSDEYDRLGVDVERGRDAERERSEHHHRLPDYYQPSPAVAVGQRPRERHDEEDREEVRHVDRADPAVRVQDVLDQPQERGGLHPGPDVRDKCPAPQVRVITLAERRKHAAVEQRPRYFFRLRGRVLDRLSRVCFCAVLHVSTLVLTLLLD